MAFKKAATVDIEPQAATLNDNSASNAVAVRGINSVPDYLRDEAGATGLEHFSTNDFKIPRLKLLQALSPEIQQFRGVAIPGQFWSTAAQKAIGDKFNMVVCLAKRRVVLWAPRDSGGGMLAMAKDGIHWNKPNNIFPVTLKNVGKVEWHTKNSVPESGLLDWGSSNPQNEDSQPAATLMYEYLIYSEDHPDISPTVISLYRTGIDAAKSLNTALMQLRNPMQAVRIECNSRIAQAKDETYFKWNFRLAGYVGEDTFRMCKGFEKAYSEFETDVADTGDEEAAPAMKPGTAI
jgi:hypothetical protein